MTTQTVFSFALSNYNIIGYDQAVRILNKRRKKQKGVLITPTNANIIEGLAKEGYFLEPDENGSYIFYKNDKCCSIGNISKTEYLYSQYLKSI